jgi:hypothetical protein
MERTIVDLVGAGSQALLAVLFLMAGLSKAGDVGRLQRTIEQLGLDRARARPAAVAVVGAELATAVGLLVSPPASWPRALVVALAGGFALAGLKALSVREPIGCSCFGNMKQGLLGWRQVALLPGWLALAAVAQARPPTWEPGQGLVGLAALVLALGFWQVAREWPRYRELRADRLAIGEAGGLSFRIAEPDGDASP